MALIVIVTNPTWLNSIEITDSYIRTGTKKIQLVNIILYAIIYRLDFMFYIYICFSLDRQITFSTEFIKNQKVWQSLSIKNINHNETDVKKIKQIKTLIIFLLILIFTQMIIVNSRIGSEIRTAMCWCDCLWNKRNREKKGEILKDIINIKKHSDK